MSATSIDWPGLNETWNPFTGCTCHCSIKTAGYNCYAEQLHTKRHLALLEGKKLPEQYRKPFNEIQFFPDRLKYPYTKKKPTTFFVGSMGDIMDGNMRRDWTNAIIDVMVGTPQHTYMLLSKQPFRYKRWTFPSNVWLGATIESQNEIDRGYDLVFSNPENKKFLSIEPLLGSFDGINFKRIDLIIVGADTTPGAKIPPIEWVRSIVHPNIWYKQNLRKYFPQLINPSST